MSARLWHSLFDLAVAVDDDGAAFVNWRTDKAKTPPRRVRAALLPTLNAFAHPRARLPAGLDASAVEALLAAGLLQSPAAWGAMRARFPYEEFPSLWDAPARDAHHDTYEDAYAAGDVPWNELPVAVEVAALIPLAGAGRPPRLLDVGCGSGHNLPLLEKMSDDVSGVDIAPSAVALARAKARRPEQFVVGSAAALPWADGSFDVVVDVGCLHCLTPAEVSAYVREVGRVLAPGGRFLCRAFKPREPEVVAAQPVARQQLGHTPDEITAFFADVIDVALVKEGPVHGIYVGVRPDSLEAR